MEPSEQAVPFCRHVLIRCRATLMRLRQPLHFDQSLVSLRMSSSRYAEYFFERGTFRRQSKARREESSFYIASWGDISNCLSFVCLYYPTKTFECSATEVLKKSYFTSMVLIEETV